MSKRRRGRNVSSLLPRAEVTLQLESAFLATDETVMATWLYPDESALPKSVMQTAERYIRDANLAAFVHSNNASSGLAYPSRLLSGIANSLHSRHQMHSSIAQLNVHSEVAKRQWTMRWRKRVGGSIGKLYGEEHMDTQLVRDKAKHSRAPCEGEKRPIF